MQTTQWCETSALAFVRIIVREHDSDREAFEQDIAQAKAQ